LLIVYGVLKIINLAHGAFLAAGAYAGVVTTELGWNPWTAPLLAFVIGVAVAALVEWRVLRRLYARPLDTILATWGLNIIVVQLITLYFGREIRFAESAIGRAVTVGGATYSEYRLVLLLLALALGVAVWLVMQRTQIGIVARAVIMNEELAQALGINTRLVRFVTFCLGAGLAALAGALLTPLVSVHPNLGVPWLINAFMLVLVAGVSLANLALAALVLDFAGPFEVFSRTRLVPGPESRRSEDSAPFHVFTVAKTAAPIQTTGGLRVIPHYGFADAPRVDLVVVPGGWGTRALLHDAETLDWIRRAAARARKVTTVCTGSLLVAKAGLLEGRHATTHWGALDTLDSLKAGVT